MADRGHLPLHPNELQGDHAAVERYYSLKGALHGPTPAGVDWPSAQCQELRIAQLLEALDITTPCSLNDLGCGYGAALAVLSRRCAGADIDYLGIDLSSEMVRLAQAAWSGRSGAAFTAGHVSPRVADYSIASGIFNVKLGCPHDRWEELVRITLQDLSRTSRRGFAVNFLLASGQPEVPGLYRSLPAPWVQYCASECGVNVEIVSGYGLPEFSLVASIV